MKKKTNKNLLQVLFIFLLFAFPLYAESNPSEYLKSLLEEFSKDIENIGHSIQTFETILLADTELPQEKETLRLHIEKKIQEYKPEDNPEGSAAPNVEKRERIGSGGSVPRGDTNSRSINIQVRSNKADNIFYEGDKMFITLYSDTACYFQVYNVDTAGSRRLIYPNELDRDNYLTAGSRMRIPAKSSFTIVPPYGEEHLLVFASRTPFKKNTDPFKGTEQYTYKTITYKIVPKPQTD